MPAARPPVQPLRILLANEPRAYREVLAATLRILRPQVELRTADAGALDDAIAQQSPHLVVSSRLTPSVEGSLAWVLLYPEGAAHAVVSVAGLRTTQSDLDLDALLALIDWTAVLAQMR